MVEPADMRQMTEKGRAIEETSFLIIDQEAGNHGFPSDQWEVVRRVVHSSADFEFIELIRFHPEAVQAGIDSLRSGCNIVVDVKMISVGLSQERLDKYHCPVHCFISDDDVIRRAKAKNSTRAVESIQKAKDLRVLDGSIIAIGNAPTALLEVCRLVESGEAKPALVIGVPVGFVSAPESKEACLRSRVPYITSVGRKGGSPVAVAVIHALLTLTAREGY